MDFKTKKAKILCTIGPSSNKVEVIRFMYNAGMDAARINTSHGTFDDYREIINNLREVANMPIVMDTQGPKIRLRMKRDMTVKPGDHLRVGFEESDEFYLDAPVFEQLDAGDHALMDDGAFEAIIEKKDHGTILFRFMNGGTLTSGRAVNFPRKELPLATLSDKDKESLLFAKEMDIDYIALSFTRGKDDLKNCRYYMGDNALKIIAKIENQQGIDNFDEILKNADGIMVARGDMGVELPPEEIPILQKQLIHKCNDAGKPVITATQMLQSMVNNPRPTRAETSDVANAILDGSDAVMLSGETANGKYPVESVRMMARIAIHAEKEIDRTHDTHVGKGVEQAICDSVKSLSRSAGVKKIVTVTRHGNTPKLISRLRLQPNIYALTSDARSFRELHLYFGIIPVMYNTNEELISAADAGVFLHSKGVIEDHELILITSAEHQPSDLRTNAIQIVYVGDLIRCYGHDGTKCLTKEVVDAQKVEPVIPLE